MFKISDFSRLSHVTTKALRYYDRIGLFTPAYVDRFTGYRYYTADQLPRLNRILALKELNLSLAEIGRVLDEALTTEEFKGMLRLKQTEVRQQLTVEQSRLRRIELWLDQIEQENRMPTYEVILKQVPAQQVASLRRTVPTIDEFAPHVLGMFGEVSQHMEAYKDQAEFYGSPILVSHDGEWRETDIDVETAMPVKGVIEDGDQVKIRELAAVEHMACAVHHGDLSALPQAYQALMRWIEAHDYHVAGPPREVYIQFDQNGDPADYVTEVQIPLTKT
ncbi:MAG: MerR family transcriptional regulator [Spongiibacter sp.]|nr:MerR family transcriptional regulator [Spongiibacter sp.]